MSTMLNFKHGLYGGLFNTDGSNKLPISNGTIYVTTDEKAMYVDLNNQRIRLSQIITLADIAAWQNLTPPYSTEAFYYISQANALLKYTGSEWVQLNSTADIDNALAGLGFLGVVDTKPADGIRGQICTVGNQNYIYDDTVEGNGKWVAIGTVGEKILEIDSALNSLEELYLTLSENFGEHVDEFNESLENIDYLNQITGYIGKKQELPSSANVGDICIHDETIKVWVAAVGDDPESDDYVEAHWEPLGNLSLRIETLKARLEEIVGTDFQEISQILSTLQTNAILKDGSVAMTGDLNLGGKRIVNLANPEADTDAVNRGYVTGVLSGYAKTGDLEQIKEDILGKYTNEDGEKVNYTGTVGEVVDQVVENSNEIASLKEGVDNLNETIDGRLQAADAMVYMGTVSAANDLPKQAKIGYTYKAIAEFKLGDTQVYIGDLLIARGTEDENLTTPDGNPNANFGYITAESLTWDHVSSGYRAEYVPASGVTTLENGATINLTSSHAASNMNGDLGAIALTGAGAITITAEEGTDKKGGSIAIGMAWGSF